MKDAAAKVDNIGKDVTECKFTIHEIKAMSNASLRSSDAVDRLPECFL